MKIEWQEWQKYRSLLNEFEKHNNEDGEKARRIADGIITGATVEIPDDVFADMKEFCDGIEFSRAAFEMCFMKHRCSLEKGTVNDAQ